MIKNIDLHIVRLLFSRDILIIPGFGGFVARQEPAKLDSTGLRMYAPAKKVLFNPQLLTDDGILIQSIVRYNGLSYNQAQRSLESVVQNWKVSLANGRKAEVKGLGSFELDKQNGLRFEQESESNLSQYYFGLSWTKAVPLKFVESKPEAKASPQIGGQISPQTPMGYRAFKRSSVAAITILTLTASYLYLLSFKPETAARAGIDIFRSDHTTQVSNPQVQDEDAQQLAELKQGIDAIKADLEAQQEILRKSSTLTPIEEKPVSNKTWHIIGGSYATYEQALVGKKALSTAFTNVVLLEAAGRYRLSIAQHKDAEEAKEAMAEIKKELMPTAWLLETDNQE